MPNPNSHADTEWTWREIHPCEETMIRLVKASRETYNPKYHEVVQQCARELLLMEAGDWQQLITTEGARDYAELRCAEHINVFQQLVAVADKVAREEHLNETERALLSTAQERDRCFPDIDLKLWM